MITCKFRKVASGHGTVSQYETSTENSTRISLSKCLETTDTERTGNEKSKPIKIERGGIRT
jgi:hypothetical protein